ncbi:MAG: hypothetical protein QMD65_01530 [Patescibacteria group bacterium]|nr:hypothetical protein [Patescibacteria group bacterium]
MPKRFFKIISIITVISLISLAFPASLVFAQSPTIQKAIENVRDRLDNLVTAKDENNPNELNFRIETFKKVIDLSITEVKDLKVKLFSIDRELNEATKAWQKAMVENLDKALEYYNKQAQLIGDSGKNFDIQTIKSTALEFKNWRETNYLDTANQIKDFFLIDQEAKAIQIATRRLQKISDDLKKLNLFLSKGSDKLNGLFSQAKTLIKNSENLNNEAYNLFNGMFINRFRTESLKLSATSSPSSTALASTEVLSENQKNTEPPTSTAISTPSIPIESATTTATSTPETNSSSSLPILPNPSIKDLIKDSLSKIKEAYQVFIEMSNSVRELLK